MVKVVVHILAAIGIGYWLYRTAKKALNEPPEEERCYSSSVAAIMDGAMSEDDNWYDDWVFEQPEE